MALVMNNKYSNIVVVVQKLGLQNLCVVLHQAGELLGILRAEGIATVLYSPCTGTQLCRAHSSFSPNYLITD